MKGIISAILVLVLCQTAKSQESTRTLTNINDGWGYLENNTKNLESAVGSSDWEAIKLPHTWNNMDATDLVPGYRRNASWYRRGLSVQKNNNSRYFLYFEGANNVAEVFVNGQWAGQHVGGYLGFDIEITKWLSSGENEVMVRVDNGYNKQLIPSQQSDFFIFGGLTRDVWLKEVAVSFIKDVEIRTPKVSAAAASTSLEVEIDAPIKGMILTLSVINPQGEVVLNQEVKAKTNANTKITFDLQNPALWHVDTPNLYTATLALFDGKEKLDEINETFGYRWFEFKEHGPFYLNGERLVLRGTHRHEEIAGYGAAMPNSLHRSDMEAIKEMGANFVRLGHYPQDPEVYKACNELGILVWDELPWCRGGVGDEVWKKNTRNYLIEMIDQNYNHPSIIIWSMGNEIYWLPEFEDGDNPDKMNVFLKEIHDLTHQLDPHRLTAIRKYYDGAHIVDVFSPSIWSGWYSGNYKNYETAINKSIQKYPRFVHMEYGGSSFIGRHAESPITGDGFVKPDEWEEPVNQVEVANIAQSGDWSENYIVDLFDWHLALSETHPDFAGNAQWAFRDFGTPLRPENDIPYMNEKGLMDRAGNPKDAYYVFKSYWSKGPFAYIESHTWTERQGPADLPRNISVYSNVDSVELVINGKSRGVNVRDIKKFPACGLNWEVLFDEGENTLLAHGWTNGEKMSLDSTRLNYSYEKSGKPEGLYLSYELLKNGNYLVTATARDIELRRCLDYEKRVYFQCMEGGDLLSDFGTATSSPAVNLANGRAAIEVIPDDRADKIIMTVLNQDFKGTFLEIDLEQAP